MDHEANCNALLLKAHSFAENRDYTQAQDCLAKALSEAGMSKQSWLKPRVLREIAEVYLAQDDYKNAESTARALIEIYNATPEAGISTEMRSDLADSRSRARLQLVEALSKQKRYEEAIAVLSQARDEMTNNFGNVGLQADLDSRYVKLLRDAGKTDNAGNSDIESSAFLKVDAVGIRKAAVMMLINGKTKEAIESYKKSQKMANATKSEKEITEAGIELAYAEFIANDMVAARAELEKLERSGCLDRATKHKKAQFLTLRALTATDTEEGKKDLSAAEKLDFGAVDIQLKTVFIPRKIKFETKIPIYDAAFAIMPLPQRMNFLFGGFNMYVSNDSDRSAAVQYYLSRANNALLNINERILCREAAADILRLQGRTPEAHRLYQQAINLREEMKDAAILNKREALFHLAKDYLMLGQTKKSLSLIESASAIKSTSSTDFELVTMSGPIRLLADNYFADHSYKKAAATYDKILSFTKRTSCSFQIKRSRRIAISVPQNSIQEGNNKCSTTDRLPLTDR